MVTCPHLAAAMLGVSIHGSALAPLQLVRSGARGWRGALVCLAAVYAIAMGPAGASADCIGPTVSHDGGDLAHGDLITVSGIGFGDSCYDTGPPPPGVGDLGRPLEGIEVYLAQEDQLYLVATGNADQAYSWGLSVPIPAVLDVGEVDLIVKSRGSEAYEEGNPAIWVTSDRADDSSIDVLRFGPVDVGDPGTARPATFQGTDWSPVILLVSTAAAVTLVIAVRRRRSSNSRFPRR